MDKKKFELEYIINTSPSILYNCLSTPSGLSEWFADDVNVKKNVYTFFWDGSEENALLISQRKGEIIRFRWQEEENDEIYFQFEINIDPLTNEVALIIVDFAETEEIEEASLMWDNAVGRLKQAIGG